MKPDSDLFQELQPQLSIKVNSSFAPLIQNTHFQLICHYVQSLKPHLNQIVNDPVCLSSKIILLSETWTLPTDDLDIPGFQMVFVLHCPTNRKAKDSCFYVSDSLNAEQAFSKLFTIQSDSSSVSISMVVKNIVFCSVYSSLHTPNFLLLKL